MRITGGDQYFEDGRGAGRNPNAPGARRAARRQADVGRKGRGKGKYEKTAADVTDEAIVAALRDGKDPAKVFAKAIGKMAPDQARKTKTRIAARKREKGRGRPRRDTGGMYSDSKGY